MDRAKIAVIIPIYNAEKTLKGVFERIPQHALKKINEFILINDGSKDNSQNVIENLKQRYVNLVVITNRRNLGYGAAQKIGFKQALVDNMDIVVILHADGQYSPEMITNIIEPIEKGKTDVVGGNKLLGRNVLKQGMPLLTYIGQFLLNIIENFVFKQKLAIYHSGYRAYSKRTLEVINFNNYSNYFSFDSEMLIGSFVNNLKIYEIPIPTYYGQGKSYLNPIRYTGEILLIIVKYLFKQYDMKTREKE